MIKLIYFKKHSSLEMLESTDLLTVVKRKNINSTPTFIHHEELNKNNYRSFCENLINESKDYLLINSPKDIKIYFDEAINYYGKRFSKILRDEENKVLDDYINSNDEYIKALNMNTREIVIINPLNFNHEGFIYNIVLKF